jgi:hypothetical protein
MSATAPTTIAAWVTLTSSGSDLCHMAMTEMAALLD